MSALAKMKVAELREALEAKGLDTTGLKSDLVTRLEESLAKMKVAELREALEAKGLDTAGLKSDLVTRLEESLAKEKDTVEEGESDEKESTQPKAMKNRILDQVAAEGDGIKPMSPVTTPTRRSRRLSEDFTSQDITAQLKAAEAARPLTPTRRSRRLSEDFTGQDITAQLKAAEAARPLTPTRKRLSETSRPLTPTRQRLSQSSAAPDSPSRKSRRLSGGIPELVEEVEEVEDTPARLGGRRSRRLSGTEEEVVQSPVPVKRVTAGRVGRRVSAIAAVPEIIEEVIEEECVTLNNVSEEPEDEIENDATTETELPKVVESPNNASKTNAEELNVEEKTTKADDSKIDNITDTVKVSETNESPNKFEKNAKKENEKPAAAEDSKIVETAESEKVVEEIKSTIEVVKKIGNEAKDDSKTDVNISEAPVQKRSIDDSVEKTSKKAKNDVTLATAKKETPKKDTSEKSVEVAAATESSDKCTKSELSLQKKLSEESKPNTSTPNEAKVVEKPVEEAVDNKENVLDKSSPKSNPAPKLVEDKKNAVLTENVDAVIAEMDVSMSKACDDVITGTNDVIQMMKKELAARKEQKKGELLVEAKHIPRQKPKSGKFWKAEREAFRSLKKDKGQRCTFEQRLKMKEEKLKNKELAVLLLQRKNLKKEEMRKKIEENKTRKTENEKKSEQFQIIKNPAKIKRMKKKQLRQLEKRDLLAVKT